MKTSLFALFFLFFLIFTGCKKDENSDSTTSTIVEYQISSMNNYFTQIKYTDNTGSTVVINDPSQFTNGKKSISISTKPFNAKLETTIQNVTGANINYTLIISSDGQIKKAVDVSAPANSTTSSSIEYVVQ